MSDFGHHSADEAITNKWKTIVKGAVVCVSYLQLLNCCRSQLYPTCCINIYTHLNNVCHILMWIC